MEFKNKLSTIFLSIITITYLQSCGLLGISLPEICSPFEFTLPVTIEIEGDRDTIAVGDTFMITHEMPFNLRENGNGVNYEIGPVLYDPELSVLDIKNKSFYGSDPTDFEYLAIPNSGEIVFQTFNDGGTIRHVNMVKQSTRFYFQTQVIAKKTGNYFIHFQYIEDRLNPNGTKFLLDTCGNQDIVFNYELNDGENYTEYKLGTDSIWQAGMYGLERNIFALHEKYDFFVLTVVE